MPFDIRADLTAEKEKLQLQVNAAVGRIRSRFISVIAGQEMVYLEKRDEALLIVADAQQGENVPLGETPHVNDEAADDGVSRFEKAVEILTQAHIWKQVSPPIEKRRLRANREIEAATTVQAARTAAAVDWTEITELSHGE